MLYRDAVEVRSERISEITRLQRRRRGWRGWEWDPGKKGIARKFYPFATPVPRFGGVETRSSAAAH